MADIVCESCGTPIGETDGRENIAAGYCPGCRNIQNKIEALREECEQANAARRATEQSGGWCGPLMALPLALLLWIVVAL